MQQPQVEERLEQIYQYYQNIDSPKYRNAKIEIIKQYYEELLELKEQLREQKKYTDLINCLSQIIKRIKKDSKPDKPWRNPSDRGMNKSIQPVVNKQGHPVDLPFGWNYPNTDELCSANGLWNAENFMVMDVIGYIWLLKEGGGVLPKKRIMLFSDLESIMKEEIELRLPTSNSSESKRFTIHFYDKYFRRFTQINYSSNDIKELLHRTSQVKLKLLYPVRLPTGNETKEQLYPMSTESNFFEFESIDNFRKDGILQSREYNVSFNTLLGKLFVHNLLSWHRAWLDSDFYSLPQSAQFFYRQFIIHTNYETNEMYLSLIKERLHLHDSNTSNQIKTIENSIMKPLMKHNFIKSYDIDREGLWGIKFIIQRDKK